MKTKTIIFLGDGMADEPVAELGNRTPLQAANTPAMDRIAREGASGTLRTLPEGFPTSSEVANMSVLGCDLHTEYGGRGPLEAAGRDVPMGPQDIAFRCNLTTVQNGILTDFSGGHLPPDAAAEIIDFLNHHLGSDTVRFHTGVSYRNLLILSGPDFSERVKTEKPDDNQGEPVAQHLPVPVEAVGEHTADFLCRLMTDTATLLEACPANQRLAAAGKPVANGLWPWSGGKAGALKPIREKYGISGAVISAVDVIVGLGKCLGMETIAVPGATGFIDTNYEGKADAAIDAIQRHDLVYLHVEAIDEVSHMQDLKLKLRAIEDFDARVIARVIDAIGPDVAVAVLPDHPVPVALGKHTRTPVPVALRKPGMAPDSVQAFNEIDCLHGALGAMQDGDLMSILFPHT
jgi:2,3-bisphosphoglycerate-independent phosphoglycerate mutase